MENEQISDETMLADDTMMSLLARRLGLPMGSGNGLQKWAPENATAGNRPYMFNPEIDMRGGGSGSVGFMVPRSGAGQPAQPIIISPVLTQNVGDISAVGSHPQQNGVDAAVNAAVDAAKGDVHHGIEHYGFADMHESHWHHHAPQSAESAESQNVKIAEMAERLRSMKSQIKARGLIPYQI